MKKTLTVFIVIFSIVIASCKKDDNSYPNNLARTSWVYSASSGGVNLVETIKFTSNKAFTFSEVYTGTTNSNQSITGNYSYEPPDISFEISTYGGDFLRGTINGNSMTLSFPPLFDTTRVYTKQ